MSVQAITSASQVLGQATGQSDLVSNIFRLIFGQAWEQVAGSSQLDFTLVLGQSGNVLNDIFLIWNSAIFMLTTLYISKTIIQALTDSSTHGEVLGRQVSTVASGVRFSTMLFMVAPIGSSGYSISQVIVLYAISMATSLGNMASSTLLSDLQSGPMLTPPAITIQADPIIRKMFLLNVCKAYSDIIDTINTAAPGTFGSGIVAMNWDGTTTPGSFYLHSSDNQSSSNGATISEQDPYCGKIVVPMGNSVGTTITTVRQLTSAFSSSNQSKPFGTSSTNAPPSLLTIGAPLSPPPTISSSFLPTTINQINTYLYPYAYNIVLSAFCVGRLLNSNLQLACKANAQTIPDTSVNQSQTPTPTTPGNLATQSLMGSMTNNSVFSTADNMLEQAVNLAISQSIGQSNQNGQYWTLINKEGWGGIGQLMPYISAIQGEFDQAANDLMPTVLYTPNDAALTELKTTGVDFSSALKSFVKAQQPQGSSNGSSSNLLAQADGNISGGAVDGGDNAGVAGWFGRFTSGVSLEIDQDTGIYNYQNPIGGLQVAGDRIISAGVLAIGMVAYIDSKAQESAFKKTVGLVKAGIESIITGNPLPAASEIAADGIAMKIGKMVAKLYPFIIPLIVAGGVLAYVLPLMPYFIYTMAVLGWIAACCAAVAGAPLWAASHSIPEGDNVFSQTAVQGYKMLAAIIAKPTLIVLGFYFSFAIFSGAIYLLQSTYGVADRLVFQNAIHSGFISAIIGALIGTIFMTVAGIAIVYMVAKYCFSLIHVIPDLALQWGGLNDLNTQEEQTHGESYAYISGAGMQIKQNAQAFLPSGSK